MNKEQRLLGKIVLMMLRRQEHWLLGASEPGLELYSQILSHYQNPYRSDELEKILALSPERFSTKNRFVFLEPIDEDILPILTFWYDFTGEVPIVSLQVGMFKMSGNRLAAQGFRFEVPEGEGKHNYYRAQPLDTLRNGSFKLPCPPLLSATCPSFALDALNIGTLLLCVIVSLYGRKKLEDLQTAGLRSQLRRYTQDLHWDDPALKRGNRFEYDSLLRWRQAPRV